MLPQWTWKCYSCSRPSGVQMLHGIPGLLGGLFAALAVLADNTNYMYSYETQWHTSGMYIVGWAVNFLTHDRIESKVFLSDVWHWLYLVPCRALRQKQRTAVRIPSRSHHGISRNLHHHRSHHRWEIITETKSSYMHTSALGSTTPNYKIQFVESPALTQSYPYSAFINTFPALTHIPQDCWSRCPVFPTWRRKICSLTMTSGTFTTETTIPGQQTFNNGQIGVSEQNWY